MKFRSAAGPERAAPDVLSLRRDQRVTADALPGGAREVRRPLWPDLPPLVLTRRKIDRGRLISQDRRDPAHARIDLLRTRMMQAFREKGWKRLVVTSPTQGCGKTFVAANLALSLARVRGQRVMLFDMDLRRPGLAKMFSVSDAGSMTDFIDGAQPPEQFMRRFGDRLALGLNGFPLPDPSETIQDPATLRFLERMEARLESDFVVYDLPPMLACDDTVAFLPFVDCALLVAGAGETTAPDLEQCLTLLEGRTPVLGVVLNRAEDHDLGRYYYS